jgi:site-specific DNA recombinase
MRSLAIVDDHAAIVRDIFARYLALGNVRLLADQLSKEGIRSPTRVTGRGKPIGGCRLTRGQLYYMLKNPIYAGDIAHKGKVYPGNHAPIIDKVVWERVQQQLAANLQGQRTMRESSESSESLLAGLLFDADGEPLVPVHTRKGPQRYRYYVSRALQHGTVSASAQGLRIPAREIEQVIRQELAALLGDPLLLAHGCGLPVSPRMLEPITRICADAAHDMARSHAQLARIIKRIVIHPDRLDLELSTVGIADMLGITPAPDGPQALVHSATVRLTRTGHVVRLVQCNGLPAVKAADPVVVRLLLKARRWWAELAKGEIRIAALSERENISPTYIARVVQLAFLSPDVVEAILAGTLRAEIGGVALLKTDAIPGDWKEQAVRFLSGRDR